MGRMTGDMSMMEIIMVMSEGNPGAMKVVVDMIKQGESIDPDAFMGGLSSLQQMDSLEIYGSRIYMLYADVCRRDMDETMGCLRAVQLGLMKAEDLDSAIAGKPTFDVTTIVEMVRKELPGFAPNYVPDHVIDDVKPSVPKAAKPPKSPFNF
jgi:hypothetical protein